MANKKTIINTYYCTINLDVYRTAVLVLVSSTMENVIEDLPSVYKEINPDLDPTNDIKEIERIYKEDGYMPQGQTIRLANDTGDVIMIYKADSISSVSKELIVHETHHASHYLCEYRGINDEECEAYIQEHLFNQMMCKIDEWNAKHKKNKK